jgi:hypothetical protein
VTTPEQLSLIHAEIDGELDATQRAELSRSLLADPELRRVRDDLRRVCAVLDGVGQVEPPGGLEASILAALPHKTAVRGQGWAMGWRYAACLAGVAVAAAITFNTMRGSHPAPGELTGTIAARAAPVLVDSTTVSGPGVSGRASLYHDSTGFSLELALTTDAALDVRVAGEGYTLALNNLKNQGGSPIRRSLPGLEPGAGHIDLTFLAAGRPVGSATLRAEK